MFHSKPVLPLLLALFLCGLAPVALSADMSTAQTALRIARDEMRDAEAERDADARRAAATTKEVVRLKKQLEAEQKKAAQSEKRYVESRERHDKAQAAFDRAWKR
jgi:Sec-independent protein translocase protein TatA